MKTMSEPNKQYMHIKLDNEGFHYAFIGYSDFEEVQDEHFHELRKKYVAIAEELCAYMDYPNGL